MSVLPRSGADNRSIAGTGVHRSPRVARCVSRLSQRRLSGGAAADNGTLMGDRGDLRVDLAPRCGKSGEWLRSALGSVLLRSAVPPQVRYQNRSEGSEPALGVGRYGLASLAGSLSKPPRWRGTPEVVLPRRDSGRPYRSWGPRLANHPPITPETSMSIAEQPPANHHRALASWKVHPTGRRAWLRQQISQSVRMKGQGCPLAPGGRSSLPLRRVRGPYLRLVRRHGQRSDPHRPMGRDQLSKRWASAVAGLSAQPADCAATTANCDRSVARPWRLASAGVDAAPASARHVDAVRLEVSGLSSQAYLEETSASDRGYVVRSITVPASPTLSNRYGGFKMTTVHVVAAFCSPPP